MPVFCCRVPDAWKQLLKLARHPCLAINLYKHYLTSSNEQLAQHHKVTVNRLSNRTNSKPGPNRLEGLNAYQVGLIPSTSQFM